MKSLSDTYVLKSGTKMPGYGTGTYGLKKEQDCRNSVSWALQNNVRSIDCASAYKNEHWVGEEIKNSGIPRDELFITSKVWNAQQGYEETKTAFYQSCEKLQTDYLDLYLIHWPCPKAERYTDTWKAMIDLQKQGKIRAIGVSNFYNEHLEKLIEETGVIPEVNQIEYHPWLQEEALIQYMREKQIQPESWSPLVRKKILQEPVLLQLAEKYHKSSAQIVLRWNIQNGVIIIPRSSNLSRVKENMDIFDFSLSEDDMELIHGMQNGYRNGFDSNEYHFDANYKEVARQ